MIKLVVLYKKPANTEEFEKKYFEEHLPLSNKMPGLRKAEISRFTGAPQGEAPYYLMAELYFDDMDALKAAMSSDEGKAAAKNLMSFAADIVTMMFAKVEEKAAVSV